MKLKLNFSSPPSNELLNIAFIRDDGTVLESVRRKSVAVRPDDGSFQWTIAVRAFAVLALGTLMARLRAEPACVMSGDKGSLAASLDYAISKPTSWIVDLFGRESSGRAAALRIFKRENPERKKAGPVRIQFCNSLQEDNAIEIEVERQRVTEVSELELLARAVEGGVAVGSESKSKRWWEQEWFAEVFAAEALSALQETELFEPMALERAREVFAPHFAASDQESFESVISRLRERCAPQKTRYRDIDAASAEKLRSALPPMRVALFPGVAGVLTIFQQFKSVFMEDLLLEVDHPGTRSILEAEAPHTDDLLLALSWAASVRCADQLAQYSYEPLMLLPRTSVQLMVSPECAADPARVTELACSGDPAGIPKVYMTQLQQAVKPLNSLKVQDATLAEIIKRGTQKQFGGILGFPFWAINGKLHGLVQLNSPGAAPRIGDNVLWVPKKLFELCGSELHHAIRSVWYGLLEEPARVTQSVRELLRDNVALGTAWSRFGGLYQFSF